MENARAIEITIEYLEYERDEANAEIARLKSLLKESTNCILVARDERDEAREWARKYYRYLNTLRGVDQCTRSDYVFAWWKEKYNDDKAQT